tara:strand:+ start:4063 stop:4836 length:774 start_codon:yes stop_codon:yes gene_type:complete
MSNIFPNMKESDQEKTLTKSILSDKNCLITGATGGLGREIAKLFVEKNCNLYLTGTNNSKLSMLSDELKTANKEVNISYCDADLASTEEIYKLIKEIRKEFSSIDIVINCAGIFLRSPLSNSSLEEIKNCLNINVQAPILLSKEFSQDMVNKKWGRIVNIGSSSSYQGFKNSSIYCTTKHALLGFSRSILDELKNDNVRTFCISPGSIKTKMGETLVDQDYNTFLNPKEIAETVIFVISFDNEMIIDELKLNRIKIE